MSDERLSVFVAALEQAEQLMNAASAVGPAARPLPLFYSLSQAGRAIAAARLSDRWRLAGHGLSAPPKEVGDVTELVLHPRAEAKSMTGSDRRSSFAGVAKAIGSDGLTGEVQLGEVWAAVPDMIEPLHQIPGLHGWRRPLQVFGDDWHTDLSTRSAMGDRAPLQMLVSGLPEPHRASVQDILDALAHYPVANDVAVLLITGDGTQPEDVRGDWAPNGELCPVVQWKGRNALEIDTVAPPYRGTGPRLLIPRLRDHDFFSPLMLWWLLLFGLSSVARYEPEIWIAALDLNSSEQAVPLEEAMDVALEALPELVLAALTA